MLGPCGLVVAIGLAGFVAGCSHAPAGAPQFGLECDYDALAKNRKPGPALVAIAYGSISEIPLGAVLIGDRRLYKRVIVQSLFARRTPTGTLKVTAGIVNCGRSEVVLRARAVFLDQDLHPVESPSAWLTVIVAPRSVGSYEESSFSADKASQYYLEFAP
ncbi:MAG: hypothetical protein ABIQ65_01240 [Thermoanaerobaculia bacterium]